MKDDGSPFAERVRYVTLTKDWKGDDNGLKYVEQLTKVRRLLLLGNVKISDERLKELTDAFPKIRIARRKTDAMLGIEIQLRRDDSKQLGIPIDRVKAKSPALKAGILSGDIITQFDDKPVKDWDQFLELMDTKKAGDDLKLVINRNEKTLEFEVKLDTMLNHIEDRE